MSSTSSISVSVDCWAAIHAWGPPCIACISAITCWRYASFIFVNWATKTGSILSSCSLCVISTLANGRKPAEKYFAVANVRWRELA